MVDLPNVAGFRVLEELGSGALSTVYAAVEEPLGRKVALKILKTTIPPSSPFAAQLEREARVLAELGHPNIGLLLGFSKTQEGMHLVLEFVDGFSLATLLRKRPTTSPEAVAAIGAAVARGLAHAHELGIVHRDIKPANILVSRLGEVKVFDFGIAQRAQGVDEPVALAPLRLEDVAAFGTPAYMSPEQILGERVDLRSDVFSLGVVLYQMVCGARPFERADEGEGRTTAHRIRRDPPIPLHRRSPDVPPALERIVMRAIEKLPADRFQDAARMAEQLEQLASPGSGLRGDPRVLLALESAGLVAARSVDRAAPRAGGRRPSVGTAISGLAAIAGAMVAGGAMLQIRAHRGGESESVTALELAPQAPGYLRVLATPWAEFWIDGQRVDSTPTARAIALRPGTHYVKLIHPRAPVEKRTVSLASGETKTIDVVMTVAELAPKADIPTDVDRERAR